MLAPLVVPLVVLGTAMLILFNYISSSSIVGIPFEFGSITDHRARDHRAARSRSSTLMPRLERIPIAHRGGEP